MNADKAAAFAAQWIAAWNSHDLDQILSHYADCVVFRSPNAARLVGDGVVRGKSALRAYWAMAFDRLPDLEFVLTDVLVGAGALTILYRNERGQPVAETMIFAQDGTVTESLACYSGATEA